MSIEKYVGGGAGKAIKSSYTRVFSRQCYRPFNYPKCTAVLHVALLSPWKCVCARGGATEASGPLTPQSALLKASLCVLQA